jgi:hypothetical protein
MASAQEEVPWCTELWCQGVHGWIFTSWLGLGGVDHFFVLRFEGSTPLCPGLEKKQLLDSLTALANWFAGCLAHTLQTLILF